MKKIVILLCLLILLTGCSTTYKYENIKYDIDNNWDCKNNKAGTFCTIGKNLSMTVTNDKFSSSIDNYLVEMDSIYKDNKNYTILKLDDVKIDGKKGLNHIFTMKTEKGNIIKYNKYFFQYKNAIYVFEYFGYEKEYEKYLKEYNEVIKTIKTN